MDSIWCVIGGLICRAYVERYNDPPVYNLITWASPHDGIYGTPDWHGLCPEWICPWMPYFFDIILDGYWIDQEFQETFSFAYYWKDPLNYDGYLEENVFLADINNERENKNSTYKKHITSLNTMVLVASEVDVIIYPKTSAWFEFYEPNSIAKVIPLRNSTFYKEDWLGIQTLDLAGKLKLYSCKCPHSEYPTESCKKVFEEFTLPYLNNTF